MASQWLNQEQSPHGRRKRRGNSSTPGSTTPKHPRPLALASRDREHDEASIYNPNHTLQLPSSSHQAPDPLLPTHGISSAPRPPSPPQLWPFTQHESGSSHAVTQSIQDTLTTNAPTSSAKAPLPPSGGVPIGCTRGGALEPPKTSIPSVVWDSAKLILRVGTASAEAFAPAKAAVVGVKEILTIWKVSYS